MLKNILAFMQDENDNAPVFGSQNFNISVCENTPVGSIVIVVIATDEDSGENGRLVYSIVNITGGDAFSIDESTGVIQTTIPFDGDVFASGDGFAGPYDLMVRSCSAYFSWLLWLQFCAFIDSR